MSVTGIGATSQLRFKITLSNNASAERWVIDDVVIKGTSAATITTGNPTGTPVCADGSSMISVPYTVTSGTVSGVYSVLLSDASGSFASGTTSLSTSSTSSPLVVAIPKTVAGGTAYLVKAVVGGSTGSANATPFTINNVSIAPTTAQSVAINTNGTALGATENGGTATARQWYYSTTSGSSYTNTISGATGTSYTPNFATAGTYYVVVQTTFPASGAGTCTVTSNEVAVTVTNPTITTGAVSTTPYCAVGIAAPISVPFTTSAPFPAGTTFSVQLSNSGGTFASGTTIIGTGTTSPIAASIPAGTNGANYYVRVISTSPAVNSTNSKNITVYGTQTVSISPTAVQTISKNGGTGTQLTVSETPSADVASRQWAYSATPGGPYTAISGQTTNKYTPAAADFGGTTGTYYVVEQSAFTTCGTTTTSNEVTVTVVDTRIVANPTSLSGFLTQAGSASAAQTYTLQGYDLLGNVTLTIPSGFEAAYSTSATPPSSYSAGTGSLTVLRADALAGVTVYVRLRSAAAAGSYSGNINNASSGAIAQLVAVSGTVTSLTASATTLTAFNTLAGTASVSRSFTVTGSYLTDPVTVAAPAEYEVATTTAGPYSSGLTLIPSGATNSVSATISVRLTGNTAGTYAGNVVVSSPNAATSNVAVTGKVVSKPAGTPTIAAGTPSFNSVTLTLGAAADGTNLLVVVRPASSTATVPTDRTTYTASTTYPSGTALGNGFVVFAAANAASVTVTGLDASTSYAADVYSYNVGTAAGFENYGATGGTTSFTTPVQPASPPGLLLLEDDFNYAANTLISANGWATHSGASNNDQPAVKLGNLVRATYPAGVADTATSKRALSNSSGADVNRSIPAATAGQTIYYSVLLNLPAGTGSTYNDFFLHFLNRTNAAGTTASDFRGRLFAVSTTTGKFRFGVSISNATPDVSSATEYQEGLPYLVVVKYTYSTGGKDAVSLFVFDGSTPSLPAAEPVNPTAGPYSVTSPFGTTFNGLAIRQSSATAISFIDGVRVATGWGAAIGQPVYTATPATVNAGSYYSLSQNNGGTLTAAGPVLLENNLTLTSGAFTTSNTNLLTLSAGASVALTAPASGATVGYVNGPVARPIPANAPAASYIFPVGQPGNGTAHYRPLTLNVTAQTNAVTYIATQTEANAGQNLSTSNGSGTALLQRVSTKRFYTLTPSVAPTGFGGTVTLSFAADDYVNTPGDAGLVVAKRDAVAPDPADNNKWTNLGHSTDTGTASGPGGPSVAGTVTSNTFTNFSDFTLGATNDNSQVNFFQSVNPLPVQLSSFGAQRQVGKAVAVKWTTATEKNADHFEVQRSLNARDFVTVATTKAQGTSSQATAYAVLDQTAPAAALYYRLRQVDGDGTVAFSPVVALSGTGETAKVLLYPNPTRSSLSFIAAAATPYRVLNQLGQALLVGTTEAGTAQVNVETLPAGLYFIELQTPAGRSVQKFEKE